MFKVKTPRFLQNYFLAITSILLTLIMVEACLRTGLIMTTIFERLKAVGDQSASRRLVILGDSFIYKTGQLDRLLMSKLSSSNFQTLNLAVPGNGPFEYLSEFQIFGLKYKPNIILLEYYTGNDLTNVKDKMNWDVGLKASLRPVIRSLYLYHLFNNAKLSLNDKFFNFEKIERQKINNKLLDMAKKKEINYHLISMAVRNPNHLTDNLLMEGPSNELVWNKTKIILKKIQSLSDSINAKLYIIVFPESLQVSMSHVEFYKQLGFNIDPRVLDSSKPQTLLSDFCKKNNIAYLDLLPHFRQQTSELYLENDSHLNLAGDKLAAHLIYKFLADNIS